MNVQLYRSVEVATELWFMTPQNITNKEKAACTTQSIHHGHKAQTEQILTLQQHVSTMDRPGVDSLTHRL